MFNARFDILLYDLTSTYFESDPPFQGKRQFGHSRDHRRDCVQVVIALVVTPDGFPLAYEAMPGNTPVQIPKTDEELAAHGLTYRLRREKLRQVFRREGRYLLRSNMTSEDPAELWRHYMQLTEIEQAFKELKHHLAIRPIFHQIEERIEAHIFVSFIAYCLLVTLKNLARPQGPRPHPTRHRREIRHVADGRHPCADHRRAPSDAAPPYPAEPRARATPASTPTEVAQATRAQAPDLKPPPGLPGRTV